MTATPANANVGTATSNANANVPSNINASSQTKNAPQEARLRLVDEKLILPARLDSVLEYRV